MLLCLIQDTHNLTATSLESGLVQLKWIPGENDAKNMYYISCSPDIYYGDYFEKLTYWTTSSFALISGFDEGAQYKCTLLVTYEDGNQSEESISLQPFGKFDFIHLHKALTIQYCVQL